MKKVKQITLLPFNMAIYKRLWDNKLIDNNVFDRNGKYIKNNDIYISDKNHSELVMYFKSSEYYGINCPLELQLIRKNISDIKDIFYKFQIDFCMYYQKYQEDVTNPKKEVNTFSISYGYISFFTWMEIFQVSKDLVKLNNLKYKGE